jgi:hypothetical protein
MIISSRISFSKSAPDYLSSKVEVWFLETVDGRASGAAVMMLLGLHLGMALALVEE